MQASVDLGSPTYSSADSRLLFYRTLDARLAQTTGLRASLATAVPAGDAPEVAILTEASAAGAGRLRRNTSLVTIGRRYFETLGISVVRGRAFDDRDAQRDQRTAIVNERFVDVHLSGRDTLGQRIRFGPDAEWLTIVGIVPNVRQNESDDGAFEPGVYVPFRTDAPLAVSLIVRADLPSVPVADMLRDHVRALDPDIAVSNIRAVDEALAQSRWLPRVFGSAFAVFAGTALLMAIVGLYAVTSYSVAQRKQEIGIRLAIGAQARHIWWTVTGRTSRQLAAGVLLGSAGAAGIGQALPSILFGSAGLDPLTLAAVAALLAAVGVCASLIPARRAIRLDPVAALRAE
jgi:stage V sporulation protein SpoVS